MGVALHALCLVQVSLGHERSPNRAESIHAMSGPRSGIPHTGGVSDLPKG